VNGTDKVLPLAMANGGVRIGLVDEAIHLASLWIASLRSQ
jgi:hypothetical protein